MTQEQIETVKRELELTDNEMDQILKAMEG